MMASCTGTHSNTRTAVPRSSFAAQEAVQPRAPAMHTELDVETQRLHKVQLQRLAEELQRRRDSSVVEEKLRNQVCICMSRVFLLDVHALLRPD
jgi:hypothetical protein